MTAQSRRQREANDRWLEEAAILLGVLVGVLVWFTTCHTVWAIVAGVAAVAVLIGLICAAQRVHNLRLRQSNMADIDRMNGEQFEEYLRALFTGRGYTATLTKNGPDFGADLVLVKNGSRTVVQAKHWRDRDVGVKAVQEVVAAKPYYHAHTAIVVSIGAFTQHAINLAKANSVELWDRDRLAREISSSTRDLRRQGVGAAAAAVVPVPASALSVPGAPAVPAVADAPAPPLCPRCGRTMVRRTNGRDASRFWGCPGFPECRGTRPISG